MLKCVCVKLKSRVKISCPFLVSIKYVCSLHPKQLEAPLFTTASIYEQNPSSTVAQKVINVRSLHKLFKWSVIFEGVLELTRPDY